MLIKEISAILKGRLGFYGADLFFRIHPFPMNMKQDAIKLKEKKMAHGKFEFTGTGLSCLWLVIWTTVLSIITLGLSFPWIVSAMMRWVTKNTTIDGKQLCFKGTGLGFFGNWLLILILTVITLGIYTPWGMCRSYKWIINNTYYADEGDIEE